MLTSSAHQASGNIFGAAALAITFALLGGCESFRIYTVRTDAPAASGEVVIRRYNGELQDRYFVCRDIASLNFYASGRGCRGQEEGPVFGSISIYEQSLSSAERAMFDERCKQQEALDPLVPEYPPRGETLNDEAKARNKVLEGFLAKLALQTKHELADRAVPFGGIWDKGSLYDRWTPDGKWGPCGGEYQGESFSVE